jgi:hypothetical protein
VLPRSAFEKEVLNVYKQRNYQPLKKILVTLLKDDAVQTAAVYKNISCGL